MLGDWTVEAGLKRALVRFHTSAECQAKLEISPSTERTKIDADAGGTDHEIKIS